MAKDPQKSSFNQEMKDSKKEEKRKEAHQAENLKGRSRQKLGPKKKKKKKENPTKWET